MKSIATIDYRFAYLAWALVVVFTVFRPYSAIIIHSLTCILTILVTAIMLGTTMTFNFKRYRFGLIMMIFFSIVQVFIEFLIIFNYYSLSYDSTHIPNGLKVISIAGVFIAGIYAYKAQESIRSKKEQPVD